MSGVEAHTRSPALEHMQRKIDELPLLPQALVKLLQLNRSSEEFFDEFERVVKEDPTFAVRVIALANSASSSPVSPITSIREAITRMGAATISGLVSSLAVQRVFMPSEPGEVRLWTHSIFVACAAEEIARMAVDLRVDPGQAYLAGLLHDIGRFVMLEHAPDELHAVDASDWHTPDELLQADADVYGYTHSELGHLACHRWGLPESICELVRNHHESLPADIEPGSAAAINFCVQLGDRLSIFVLEDEFDDDEQLLARIQQTCLDPVDDRQRMAASDLLNRVSHMRDAGESLLSGLGLAA